MEKKPLKELTDKELDARIIYSGLDSIVSELEHMTSGNFMHHRMSCMLLAKQVRQAVERLGIKEV